MVTAAKVWEALAEVPDPEIPVILVTGGSGSIRCSMPQSPEPIAAASAIYGLMSAAAIRYSTRWLFGPPWMTRSAVVRFSTPQVAAVGAQNPGTSRE